jgi:hypothetical protein
MSRKTTELRHRRHASWSRHHSSLGGSDRYSVAQASSLASMLFAVSAARMFSVLTRVRGVSVGRMSVVRRFLMIAGVIMLCSLVMMLCSMGMVF